MPELPPSERDFLVFEALAFSGASTRQAAAEFDVSQTRVVQIRRHVAQWIATSVPDGLDLTPIQRLRLAAHIAQGRVDFLYSQAMEAWRQSQQPATSSCRGMSRASHGDPRYLFVAARITERQLSLAGTAHKVLTEAEEGSKIKVSSPMLTEETRRVETREDEGRQGEAWEGEAPAESWVQGPAIGVQDSGVEMGSFSSSSSFSNAVPARDEIEDRREADASNSPASVPPSWDCSPKSLESRLSASEEIESDDATDLGDEACNELESRRRAFLAALGDDMAPVHPPFTDAGGMLLDATKPANGQEQEPVVIELRVNGEQLGAAVSTTAVADRPAGVPLNRHQRRARQRELDRLRRRAK